MYIRVLHSKAKNQTYYILYVYERQSKNCVSRLISYDLFILLSKKLPVYDTLNNNK